MITKAVRLVGNKHLAGSAYLKFSAQYGFDDEVLHLLHQHCDRHNHGVIFPLGLKRAASSEVQQQQTGPNFYVTLSVHRQC